MVPEITMDAVISIVPRVVVFIACPFAETIAAGAVAIHIT
ncbi:hypothetical protein GCM10007913_26920 [Devosia yakushimensis]|uniref:Uncharacterized protein n=1 Tax=Devosia yakushimensis TaxID=470028 RepID=A0ABQ5UG71_9HYPH|nr:hypothetical protein GCM10007913_26920 [Devosia yakushimensis]